MARHGFRCREYPLVSQLWRVAAGFWKRRNSGRSVLITKRNKRSEMSLSLGSILPRLGKGT